MALVVGYNQAPKGGDQATLRYADDDAIAMHRLLLQAGVKSRILTSMDEETARRYNGTLSAPTASALERVANELHEIVERARMRGTATELYFFYSGHGDVDDGEGFVSIADGTLTRSGLTEVIRRVGAEQNHVIIDACKSYFLAFERGPGGARAPYTGPAPEMVAPADLPNTGLILSTSAAQISHESEQYEAGVFSHEIRSALRGAADADLDGAITYGEIGAFVASANMGLPARYRPQIFVRGLQSGHATTALRWHVPPSVTLPPGRLRRADVENPGGSRLMDFHAGPQQGLALRLPEERPLYFQSNEPSLELVLEHGDELRGALPAESTVDSLQELEAAFATWRRKRPHARKKTPLLLVVGAREAAKRHGLTAVVRANGDRQVPAGTGGG